MQPLTPDPDVLADLHEILHPKAELWVLKTLHLESGRTHKLYYCCKRCATQHMKERKAGDLSLYKGDVTYAYAIERLDLYRCDRDDH